jgi:hypothetical protein
MAKTSFKLPASDLCGDACAAECPVNGQKVLVVTVRIVRISKDSQQQLEIFDIF